jgi:hypothetical protein
MTILDCMKASQNGEAHINVKIGCCNKRTTRKLKHEDSRVILKLFMLSDEKFTQILAKINELTSEKND